ncbi:MAG: hypothetical protein OEZ43_14360 [Gammaproteobacteria bacterium]|nr:hypothetical protein [Gammaproteobacteria bacterium]
MTAYLCESNCLSHDELLEIKTDEDLVNHISSNLSDECLHGLQQAFADKLAEGLDDSFLSEGNVEPLELEFPLFDSLVDAEFKK